jgi:hypothetical protein
MRAPQPDVNAALPNGLHQAQLDVHPLPFVE